MTLCSAFSICWSFQSCLRARRTQESREVVAQRARRSAAMWLQRRGGHLSEPACAHAIGVYLRLKNKLQLQLLLFALAIAARVDVAAEPVPPVPVLSTSNFTQGPGGFVAPAFLSNGFLGVRSVPALTYNCAILNGARALFQVLCGSTRF